MCTYKKHSPESSCASGRTWKSPPAVPRDSLVHSPCPGNVETGVSAAGLG